MWVDLCYYVIKFDVGGQTPAHCFFWSRNVRGQISVKFDAGEQTTAHCFPGAEVFRAKPVYMWVDLCYMCKQAKIHFSPIWMLVGIDTCSRFCGAEVFRARSLYMWVDLCYMCNLAEIHFSPIWVLVGIDTCSLEQRSLEPDLCICEWISAIMCNLLEILLSQIWVLFGIDTCSLFFRSRGL